MSDKNNSSDYMEFEYKYKKNNEDEPVKVILDLSRFSNSEYTKQTNKDQAKYNVKLSKRDVYLIDEIASIENTSRAEIINRLVFNFLLEELTSINDLQLQLLIAARADSLVHEENGDNISSKYIVDYLGWCSEVRTVKSYIELSLENLFKYGRLSSDEPGYAAYSVGNKTEEELIEENYSEIFKKIRNKLLEV